MHNMAGLVNCRQKKVPVSTGTVKGRKILFGHDGPIHHMNGTINGEEFYVYPIAYIPEIDVVPLGTYTVEFDGVENTFGEAVPAYVGCYYTTGSGSFNRTEYIAVKTEMPEEGLTGAFSFTLTEEASGLLFVFIAFPQSGGWTSTITLFTNASLYLGTPVAARDGLMVDTNTAVSSLALNCPEVPLQPLEGAVYSLAEESPFCERRPYEIAANFNAILGQSFQYRNGQWEKVPAYIHDGSIWRKFSCAWDGYLIRNGYTTEDTGPVAKGSNFLVVPQIDQNQAILAMSTSTTGVYVYCYILNPLTPMLLKDYSTLNLQLVSNKRANLMFLTNSTPEDFITVNSSYAPVLVKSLSLADGASGLKTLNITGLADDVYYVGFRLDKSTTSSLAHMYLSDLYFT